MKFGKVITAAAASGVLLSGAFMIAEEYTGHSAFAVTLSDNTKVDVKAKKGTVREILAANNISYNADDRVEPGLDTKVNGGEDIRIYKAREITIQDGETTTVRKTTYKKVEDILKELNITVGAEDKVTPGLKTEVAEVDTIKIARVGKTTQTVKEAIKFETKEEKASEVGGIMHSFSGSVESMNIMLKENLHISLGGPVTFKNAKTPKEVAKACPLDRLLIETDCPYLTPTPYRGKRNEPAYVHYVAQEIADLKEMSYEQLTEQTFNNACELFKLKQKEID